MNNGERKVKSTDSLDELHWTVGRAWNIRACLDFDAYFRSFPAMRDPEHETGYKNVNENVE